MTDAAAGLARIIEELAEELRGMLMSTSIERVRRHPGLKDLTDDQAKKLVEFIRSYNEQQAEAEKKARLEAFLAAWGQPG